LLGAKSPFDGRIAGIHCGAGSGASARSAVHHRSGRIWIRLHDDGLASGERDRVGRPVALGHLAGADASAERPIVPAAQDPPRARGRLHLVPAAGSTSRPGSRSGARAGSSRRGWIQIRPPSPRLLRDPPDYDPAAKWIHSWIGMTVSTTFNLDGSLACSIGPRPLTRLDLRILVIRRPSA